MKKVILFCVFLTLVCAVCAIGRFKNNGVEEMYYWREVMYEDLPLDDNTVIGKYPYHIPTNNDVYGVGYHAKSGLMLTTVGRIRPGVPSSLNAFCVADYEKGRSPHLWGFPNYEMNILKASFYERPAEYSRSRNFRRKSQKYSAGYYNHFYGAYNPLEDFSIVSVYRPNIDDQCNLLYVIDTGLLYYGANEMYNVQNPALIVFDLPSNGCQTRKFPVIRRVEIPNHLWNDRTGLCYITHDHQQKGSCDDVVLYIANSFGDNSLTVYDYKKGSFWTFKHPSFNPIAAESRLVFNNDLNYELPVAIANVALGWPDKNGNRNAYYYPAASTGEYIVSTEVLKDRKRAPSNYNPGDFSLIAYRGCDSQSFKQVFDLSTGVMFFIEMQSHRIRCWNTQLPLNPDTIGVVFESDALQFGSDLNLDEEGYLWFHTSQLPVSFLSDVPLDLTNINSRTYRVKASEAIRGTVCDTGYGFSRRFFYYKL